MIAWVVVAGLLAAAPPQVTPRDQAAATSTGTASLSGVVEDADKNPVRRAYVTVTGDAGLTRSVPTDEKGQFTVSLLPADRYTVSAQKSGWTRANYGATRPNRPGSPITLAAGQRATGLTLTMVKGGVVTGRVIDDKGQPIPGARVSAMSLRVSPTGERTTGATTSATTDDRGIYRVFGLAPGQYVVGMMFGTGSPARMPTDAEIRVAFEAARGATNAVPPPASTRTVGYGSTFHADADDPLEGTPVEIGGGDERSVDLVLRLRPMSSVAATVMGPDGPVKNARVGLVRKRAMSGASFVIQQPDGRYLFSNVVPDDYTVLAQATGPGRQLLVAFQDVTAAPGGVDVTLALQPQVPLSGRVVFHGSSAPPAMTTVTVTASNTNRALGFNRVEPPMVEAAGAFSINGLLPGEHRFGGSIRGNAAWVLESITIGGRDVTDTPYVLSPSLNETMVVTFTDQPSELSGRLLDGDGKAAPDYFVALVPADETLWGSTRLLRFARPSIDGRYVFAAVPPGAYKFAVTPDMDASDLRDGAFLRALVIGGIDVAIAAGEKKVFDVKVK